MGSELFIKVIRYKKSYDYKRFPNKPDAWDNNDTNNMLDDFLLYVEENIIFKAKVQTVANIPNGRFLDTIAPGAFKMKCFIGEGPNGDPRNYYGKIHGITNCYDLDGQWIDNNSVEIVKGKNGAPIDLTRWLVHDTQKCKPAAPMTLTRVAWSAGCFIMIPSNLMALATILDAYKIKPYDFINGELIEEE